MSNSATSNRMRSILALLLSAILVISCTPALAFADAPISNDAPAAKDPTVSNPAEDPDPEEEEEATEPEKPAKPLEGKTISIMGDSISTYTGWSDAKPITDESCTYRYGEAYYGPTGGDFHNTDMLVSDTWWHQAATALGADILMSNAGNSTGLLYAKYPSNTDWQQYLQDMLAYKSRPYYLGTENQDPDIIALYIGSNDVGKGKIDEFGSIDDVDFSTLITKNEDGTYNYATPTTVAESYCILLHKITVTYPDAEVYCFAVLPNSGGKIANVTKRLQANYPFNEMVRGVADHYGAHMVELLDEFQLDPDKDGVITQEDFETFQSYFHNDPHPNAAGFDVITRAFVSSVLANSKYIDRYSLDPDDPIFSIVKGPETESEDLQAAA